MSTLTERRELAKQFANDVARRHRLLRDAGKRVRNDEVVYAWAEYSDSLCARWFMLPEDEEILLKILLKHLPSSPLMWLVTVQDAGDGTGDQILELPEKLLNQMGWKAGDTLSIDKSGTDELILRRVD